MARSSIICVLLLGAVLLARAQDSGADLPNWWKPCSIEAQGCQGTTVPDSYDPTTYAAAPDAVWQPTCCKMGKNPVFHQTGLFCFASKNGPDNCIGGGGDPILNGFDGRSFMFDGTPGNYYNILSEQDLMVNGHFTPAYMWDHNGTYITTMGVIYKDVRIKVHVVFDGSLEVEVNDLPLEMPKGQNKQLQAFQPDGADEDDVVSIKWEYYRKEYGHAVDINTPFLNLMIWATPPQPDKGGVPQPSYLNFNTALLKAPNGAMAGILGQSYGRALELAEAAAAGAMPIQDENVVLPFDGNTEDYIVSDLWAGDFAFNKFAIVTNAQMARRFLNEHYSLRTKLQKANLAFPLYALKRGAIPLSL